MALRISRARSCSHGNRVTVIILGLFLPIKSDVKKCYCVHVFDNDFVLLLWLNVQTPFCMGKRFLVV